MVLTGVEFNQAYFFKCVRLVIESKVHRDITYNTGLITLKTPFQPGMCHEGGMHFTWLNDDSYEDWLNTKFCGYDPKIVYDVIIPNYENVLLEVYESKAKTNTFILLNERSINQVTQYGSVAVYMAFSHMTSEHSFEELQQLFHEYENFCITLRNNNVFEHTMKIFDGINKRNYSAFDYLVSKKFFHFNINELSIFVANNWKIFDIFYRNIFNNRVRNYSPDVRDLSFLLHVPQEFDSIVSLFANIGISNSVILRYYSEFTLELFNRLKTLIRLKFEFDRDNDRAFLLILKFQDEVLLRLNCSQLLTLSCINIQLESRFIFDFIELYSKVERNRVSEEILLDFVKGNRDPTKHFYIYKSLMSKPEGFYVPDISKCPRKYLDKYAVYHYLDHICDTIIEKSIIDPIVRNDPEFFKSINRSKVKEYLSNFM